MKKCNRHCVKSSKYLRRRGRFLCFFLVLMMTYASRSQLFKKTIMRREVDMNVSISTRLVDDVKRLQVQALHESSPIRASGYRCKVVYLGCVSTRNTRAVSLFENSSFIIRPEMTKQKCFANCSERGVEMIGIKLSWCFCIANFARGRAIDVSSDGCNARCPGNPEQTCGGKYGMDIYRFAETCEKSKILDEHAIPANLGCFPRPDKMESIMRDKLYSDKLTPIKCIVGCEEGGYPFAVIPNPKTCYCMNYNRRFELKTINSSSCNRICSGFNQSVNDLNCGGTNSVSAYRTYAEEYCGRKKYLPTGSVPPIALASVPGSGNTWVRHMLEEASGIFTGSVYNGDPTVTMRGFFGEMDPADSRRTLVIKDHIFHEEFTRFPGAYEKVILLMRHPFDSIVAEFNRRHTMDHTGHAAEELFQSQEWERFVRSNAKIWSNVNKKVLKSGLPMLIVQFEDLQEDFVKEIRRMLHFIGHHPPDLEDRLSCLSRNGEGHFKRKNVKMAIERYSKSQKDFITNTIRLTRNSMQKDLKLHIPEKWSDA